MDEMTIRVMENYEVDAADFHLGNDSVDQAFKDYTHTRLDLICEGEVYGYLIITKNQVKGSDPFVRFVWIYPPFRGQAYSTKLYISANQFCQSVYGRALCSDSLGSVRGSALKIWALLVEQGQACQMGNKFSFI
jgi:hypothetical protein